MAALMKIKISLFNYYVLEVPVHAACDIRIT